MVSQNEHILALATFQVVQDRGTIDSPTARARMFTLPTKSASAAYPHRTHTNFSFTRLDLAR